MKNLLFISTYPFPLDMGSKQHAYNFLKALTGIVNVYCLFFIQPHKEIPVNPDTDLMELGIKAFKFCHFQKFKNKNGLSLFFKGILAFPNNFMNLATHRQGLRNINSFIDSYGIDIVHFEHFWYTKYALKIRRDLAKVIVYHDLHHSIFLQLAKIEINYKRKFLNFLTYIKFYIFECLLEKRAVMKVFLNRAEMLTFPKNSVHIPHIVNSEITYKIARTTDSFNILFIGAYNHSPNRRSVQFIINQILPLLTKVREHFTIHIIGPGTEKFKTLLDRSPYEKHVAIHGYIQDINEVFENMDIALFPILDGGGIKTKIIDALAAGLPVVTTPEGVDGLDNVPVNCIGIGRNPVELVNELTKLMRSYSLRQQKAEAGKSFIDREHSFSVLQKKMKKCYSRL